VPSVPPWRNRKSVRQFARTLLSRTILTVAMRRARACEVATDAILLDDPVIGDTMADDATLFSLGGFGLSSLASEAVAGVDSFCWSWLRSPRYRDPSARVIRFDLTDVLTVIR